MDSSNNATNGRAASREPIPPRDESLTGKEWEIIRSLRMARLFETNRVRMIVVRYDGQTSRLQIFDTQQF